VTINCINSSNFVAALGCIIQDVKTHSGEMSNVNVTN
jgi:hypothetical protein